MDNKKCGKKIYRMIYKKRLGSKEEKGYQPGVDTRLITPCTSYLLRRFQSRKSVKKEKKENGFVP